MISSTARFRSTILLAAVLSLGINHLATAATTNVVIDCSKMKGEFRALNSVNGGALTSGGTTDLSTFHRRAGFPMVRLHDCPWSYPEVVDIHHMFRDFRDDPALPENYSFLRTDDYLAVILTNNCQVVYRLGESIEHTKRKYDVHPPRDYDKWAAICLGIIRHYNEGWANGFRYDIRYWEIWNEPENKPVMWTGTDEQFYRLYEVAAKTIKKEFPNLKVGGPAVGAPGDFKDGVFVPSTFVADFLKRCRDNGVPLDFFSWHCYSNDPDDICARARGIRQVLYSYGFTSTESHLNEWNHLPGNNWDGHINPSHKARQEWFSQINGLTGAAYTTAVVLNMQDEPLDMAFFYTSDTGGFGLFNSWGLPKPSYYALEAFHKLLDTPLRISVDKSVKERLAIGAGKARDSRCVQMLVSHRSATKESFNFSVVNLPWAGPTHIEVQELTEEGLSTTLQRDFNAGSFDLPLALSPSGVSLLKITPR